MLAQFYLEREPMFHKYLLYTALNNRCSYEFIKKLFQKGAVVDNSKEYNSLITALRQYPEINVAKFLIEEGADLYSPDILGYFPFVYALRKNNTNFLMYLIKKGFKITTTCPKLNFIHSINQTTKESFLETIKWSALNYTVKRANKLCRICPNITMVHYAIFQGVSVKILQFLIQNGAPFKVPDIYGYTPLHYTIENNLFHHNEILIKEGQKLDKNYPDGTSILKMALLKKNSDRIIELLIKNNAKFSKGDKISTILDFILENHAPTDIITMFSKHYIPIHYPFSNVSCPL
ncbi:ankyrin repeat-containing protein [Anaeramoeba flamelloides]|uniref:Ankyrin repeat-containing protein n=1 Tax=Anaeramoeba flamelloides TaxID=1746091 RepID=A0ABQ8XTJ6_9EUKA|nr:ankyrin repeat-containing protein [Anaeramoeba flamelloides]